MEYGRLAQPRLEAHLALEVYNRLIRFTVSLHLASVVFEIQTLNFSNFDELPFYKERNFDKTEQTLFTESQAAH